MLEYSLDTTVMQTKTVDELMILIKKLSFAVNELWTDTDVRDYYPLQKEVKDVMMRHVEAKAFCQNLRHQR